MNVLKTLAWSIRRPPSLKLLTAVHTLAITKRQSKTKHPQCFRPYRDLRILAQMPQESVCNLRATHLDEKRV